jgi:hypothetical protein
MHGVKHKYHAYGIRYGETMKPRLGVWNQVTVEEYIENIDNKSYRYQIVVDRLAQMKNILRITVLSAPVDSEFPEVDGVIILDYPSLTIISGFSYYGFNAVTLFERFVARVWDKILEQVGENGGSL